MGITAQDIKEGLDGYSLELVNQWLADGATVAVYENQDLGHPELGHRQYITTRNFPNGVAPQTLPDFPDRINWRYQLIGLYAGEQIS